MKLPVTDQVAARLARTWTRSLRVGMGAVACVTFLVLWQVRVPGVAQEKRNDAFVHLGEPGGVMAEQSDLLDPAALFLPGPMNHGERLLEAVRPAGRRELFAALPGAPLLAEAGVAALSVPRSALPTADDLATPAADYYLTALGRTPPVRAATQQIEVSLRQLDGKEERRLRLEPQDMPVDGTRFARFLVRVANGRTIGDPFFLEGGGEAEINVQAAELARQAILRAHPVPNGLWELALTW